MMLTMFRGKRVVIRLDLNVPIENGKVTDATRIDRVVPTLRELLDKNAAVIVLAHFDRPKGKVVPEMSLKPVAPALQASSAARSNSSSPIGSRHPPFP